jgi:hypothetical protein
LLKNESLFPESFSIKGLVMLLIMSVYPCRFALQWQVSLDLLLNQYKRQRFPLFLVS